MFCALTESRDIAGAFLRSRLRTRAGRLCRLCFLQAAALLARIVSHMKCFKLLHGKQRFAAYLHFEVQCLLDKLKLFVGHMPNGNHAHFSRTKKVLLEEKEKTPVHIAQEKSEFYLFTGSIAVGDLSILSSLTSRRVSF